MLIDIVTNTIRELCLDCQYFPYQWGSKQCFGCKENQIDKGKLNRFRKKYSDIHRKR